MKSKIGMLGMWKRKHLPLAFMRSCPQHNLKLGAVAVLISGSDVKAQDFTCLTHGLRHAFDEQALSIDAVKLDQAF
jgi:hypothetical protein